MTKAFLRHGLSVAAVAAAAVLASCSTPEPEAPPPPPPPPPPPALALNQSVAEAASVYVAFVREVRSIQAGFPDAETIQAAVRKGAAVEASQLSRGMIAYGAILALQSPEYVAGVRQYAADPAQRQQMVARIVADPAYAATLPGAESAAGLIASTMGKDAEIMTALAEAVETDAYTIQERTDPRRRWATQPVADRNGRLESAKSLSAVPRLPSAEDSARLFAAANSGSGLNLSAAQRGAPFTPAIVNSLAIAALAALGAAGEDAKANTDALTTESNNEFCLSMSKLMLFQCLAAAKPNYEDIFCAGRHIVRDMAQCTAQYTGPMPTITVAVPPAGAPTPMAQAQNQSTPTPSPHG
ncbi:MULTISPECIES: hypothetical protein [Brevundimonas]|uniref:hypothetical protein n=1 Tax=Brevundimonas sp. LPMIX5 TaxID=2305887 RepID=UPI000E66AE65|nr:hypothetical protein [Brevundimonas sp. LPMIX5]RIJ69009.1 hypothetical protein D1604_00445 [Brevundimonas sp. LPMIX5]